MSDDASNSSLTFYFAVRGADTMLDGSGPTPSSAVAAALARAEKEIARLRDSADQLAELVADFVATPPVT